MQKGGILRNPTSYAAKPKIIIAGTGAAVLHVGDYTVNISNIGGNIIIDSDIEDAYYGSTNKNNMITLSAFPLLQPGDNVITWTGGITSCKIVPRFWRL
jgi:phage-related protein